jgi:hypothetical protein
MKHFNITAQVYSKFDQYKQTIFMNEMIMADSADNAATLFQEIYNRDHKILKIYSIEEII